MILGITVQDCVNQENNTVEVDNVWFATPMFGLLHRCLRTAVGADFQSVRKLTNVAYGLLTVGGVLTVLNIKTNALKCLIAGIFLTKGITQYFPRY